MRPSKGKAIQTHIDSPLPYNSIFMPKSQTNFTNSTLLFQISKLPTISDQKTVSSPLKESKKYIDGIRSLKMDINSITKKYLLIKSLINKTETEESISINDKIIKLNAIYKDIGYQPESEIKNKIIENDKKISQMESLLLKLNEENNNLKENHQRLVQAYNNQINSSRDKAYLQRKLHCLQVLKSQKQLKLEQIQQKKDNL